MKRLDEIAMLIEGFAEAILYIVLFLFSPIWILPYVIYKEIAKKRGGRQ